MHEEIKVIDEVIGRLEKFEEAPEDEHEEEKLALRSLKAAREYLRMAEAVKFEVAPRGHEKTWD